ncbi:hypothetical protein [Burkholderia ambifaria]|uniref:Uncharacterized protein n=1 Tax=Burkholderia ambifaria MEX-5 TaxID=396597 RepID=B1TF47_9BURK|nr:hypothetical protein [Burkholderia ambifaria]EDT37806.1 hypothetical protein BamMEX5DRAFT_6413 [Burkholderia ambifaria MEX-5]
MPIYATTRQAQGGTSRRSKEPSGLQKKSHLYPEGGNGMAKNAHFAWEGPPITQMALFNILNFQRLNTDYCVTIWTSRPLSIFATLDKMVSESIEASYRYVAFSLLGKINIEDPEILFDQLPFRLRAIHAREKSGPYKNMAAASDVVRLAALYLRGGSIWMLTSA